MTEWSGSGESISPSLQSADFSLCVHMVFPQGLHLREGERVRAGKQAREIKTFSSYKTTNPIGLGAHPYDLIQH